MSLFIYFIFSFYFFLPYYVRYHGNQYLFSMQLGAFLAFFIIVLFSIFFLFLLFVFFFIFTLKLTLHMSFPFFTATFLLIYFILFLLQSYTATKPFFFSYLRSKTCFSSIYLNFFCLENYSFEYLEFLYPSIKQFTIIYF